LTEFSSLLEILTTTPGKLCIVGDFNIHMDNLASAETKKFQELLTSANLAQHVTMPTHRCGHTLDLIVTEQSEALVDNITHHDLTSDHMGLVCDIHTNKSVSTRKTIKCRKLRGIDSSRFSSDLEVAIEHKLLDLPLDLTACVELYNTALREMLDIHAPLKTCIVSSRKPSPWYDESLYTEKVLLRRLERKYYKTKLIVDREIMQQQQRIKYLKEIERCKRAYHTERIASSTQSQLFRIINSLTTPSRDESQTSTSNALERAEQFNTYFVDKIDELRQELEDIEAIIPFTEQECESKMSTFSLITDNDLVEIILKSQTKSSPVDPIPATLLKTVIPAVLPLFRLIVAQSLETGTFPEQFKTATVRPLLKKHILDASVLKNYRPISQLPFISKVLQCVVHRQRHEYMRNQGLYDDMQSAYRQQHSVETAMLRIHNDIVQALDASKQVVLVMHARHEFSFSTQLITSFS
jgi:hypothetical protein